MLYGAAPMLQVSIENKLLLRRTLAVFTNHKRRRIQVEIRSRIKCIDIPAQSYHDFLQSGIPLG